VRLEKTITGATQREKYQMKHDKIIKEYFDLCARKNLTIAWLVEQVRINRAERERLAKLVREYESERTSFKPR
jgi:formylmethanofuran dehydrogenase subunit D